ncbi:MAG: protein kinase [Anaeromyxobacter sp.]|nr:protein kinase [Anaeromyxobacter sp.]MBL0274923.1 protein kinase [Anaeromyxobacter sp.]
MTQLLAELGRTRDVPVPEAWIKPPAAGDRIGRFELVREIGRGGFGVVFEALDGELGRPVAFKALRPSRVIEAGQAAALRDEAEAAARLNHPGIVTVHDFGTCASGPYVIMELLRGEALAERVERGPLPVAEAVHVALEVARALAHAHAAGVLHRDLNPGNVFLCQGGAVKVLDFGLARVLGSGGLRGGTPSYTAPEQWRGEADDGRADLFGLGCLLYRMLAGRTPYQTASGRLTVHDVTPPPLPDLAGVPAGLAALARRLVERIPADRPASAAEVVRLLEAEARALDPRARRVRRGLAGLGAAAVALALLVGAFAWWGPDEPPGPLAVLVADLENRTGEPELDGLAGLLGTALEQSRHLAVVSRARQWEALAQLGHGDAVRIDERLAREVARRTGVQALLLGTVHRFDGTYVLELRGLEPAAGRHLFSLSERVVGRQLVPELVDAVALRARRALAEPQDLVEADRRPVGDAVTHNLAAYRHYFAGLECMIRRSDSERVCPDHFLRALEIDPAFALAHHQLAYLLGAEGSDEAGARRENALAMAQADRAPPRERALILAFQAELEGRVEDAVVAYGEAAGRFPDDHEVHARAGYYLHRQRDWARALPFMRRAVALDPEREDVARLLVADLVQLGRLDELRQYAAAWERLPSSPARRSLLVRAWFWLGDRPRALAVAHQISAAGGLGAHYEEAVIHFAGGDFGAAASALDRDVAAGQEDAYVRAGVTRALEARGRFREALGRVPPDDAPSRRALVHHSRAVMLAAQGRGAEAWQEAQRCAEADPAIAGPLATDLLFLGDRPGAATLAAGLAPGTLDARVHAAVLAWREGQSGEAVRALQALSATEPVPSWWGMPPSWALAQVAEVAGDHATVVAAVDRLLSTWHPMSSRGGGMVPRALLLRAHALARLGRRERARTELERLLAQRAGGDPADPVAAEARVALAALEAPR